MYFQFKNNYTIAGVLFEYKDVLLEIKTSIGEVSLEYYE